jgi:hypothetical protein
LTAVDPTRLAHDLAGVLAHFEDPPLLTRRLIDLLTFYADRTRRPPASSDIRDAPLAMEVVPAALRLMTPAFRNRAIEQPAAAFPAADAMWSTGNREAQLLAAAVVGGLDSPYALEWVEARVEVCLDEVVLADLASSALAGIRRADPQALHSRQAAWLSARSRRLQQLALATIQETVDDSRSSDMPQILALLDGFPVPPTPSLHRAYEALLTTMARRHPPETARFLLDAIERPVAGMRHVLTSVLPAFPQPQRAQLELALSG